MDAAEQQIKAWAEKNAAYIDLLGLDRVNLCLTFSAGIDQKSIFQIFINNEAVPMVRSPSFLGQFTLLLVFVIASAFPFLFLPFSCPEFPSIYCYTIVFAILSIYWIQSACACDSFGSFGSSVLRFWLL